MTTKHKSAVPAAEVTSEVTAPESIKVEITAPKAEQPKLSAQTLGEQEAGRAALAAYANRK